MTPLRQIRLMNLWGRCVVQHDRSADADLGMGNVGSCPAWRFTRGNTDLIAYNKTKNSDIVSVGCCFKTCVSLALCRFFCSISALQSESLWAEHEYCRTNQRPVRRKRRGLQPGFGYDKKQESSLHVPSLQQNGIKGLSLLLTELGKREKKYGQHNAVTQWLKLEHSFNLL